MTGSRMAPDWVRISLADGPPEDGVHSRALRPIDPAVSQLVSAKDKGWTVLELIPVINPVGIPASRFRVGGIEGYSPEQATVEGHKVAILNCPPVLSEWVAQHGEPLRVETWHHLAGFGWTSVIVPRCVGVQVGAERDEGEQVRVDATASHSVLDGSRPLFWRMQADAKVPQWCVPLPTR